MWDCTLRGSLAVLFASSDFCLAERILNSDFGFDGHDFHIHPGPRAVYHREGQKVPQSPIPRKIQSNKKVTLGVDPKVTKK